MREQHESYEKLEKLLGDMDPDIRSHESPGLTDRWSVLSARCTLAGYKKLPEKYNMINSAKNDFLGIKGELSMLGIPHTQLTELENAFSNTLAYLENTETLSSSTEHSQRTRLK